MLKLTIITINYNNKEGLIKTFESIQSQTWKDFEYIVIDGGSTDGSVELIKNNPQVTKWVSEKDSGVYNAMNKGILISNGIYINFMNSGDFFYSSNTLEKIYHNLNGNESILYGNSIFFNEEKNTKFNQTPPDKLSFAHFYCSGINHQATFIKRELFSKYFLYDESYKICADWVFFIRVICSFNESYLHLKEYICYYDFSGISADPANLHLYNSERELTFEKYFSHFEIKDLHILEEAKHKRIQDILYIKKHKLPWALLKTCSKILLLFLPKQKKDINII